MKPLRISLLGSVRMVDGDDNVIQLPTRPAQALLIFLLLNRGRTYPRDLLAGLFWGDATDERARACLSTTLWRLRAVLEPAGVARGTYLTTTRTGELGFNADEVWLDVDAFERGARVLRPGVPLLEEDAIVLRGAVSLCAGELLPGFYEEWVLRERERLRLLLVRSLYGLMQFHSERGEVEESLSFGRRLLEDDPLREEVHREMMRLYVRSGQRAMALRQYDSCRAAMHAELGVAPLPETTALFREIRRATGGEAGRRAGQGREAGTAGVDAAYAAVRRAIRQLRRVLQGLNDMRERTHSPDVASVPLPTEVCRVRARTPRAAPTKNVRLR